MGAHICRKDNQWERIFVAQKLRILEKNKLTTIKRTFNNDTFSLLKLTLTRICRAIAEMDLFRIFANKIAVETKNRSSKKRQTFNGKAVVFYHRSKTRRKHTEVFSKFDETKYQNKFLDGHKDQILVIEP